MELIDNLAQSIATMEGFFKPNTIAQRNNNPGNLRTWGANPVKNGYAVFNSPEEGWAALRKQVQLNVNRGLTLEEFFGGKPGVYSGYAPSADSNDPANYARFVSGRAGIAADRPITSFLSEQTGPWPAAPSGPTWDALPEEGGHEILIYAGVAMLAIAVAWMLVD